ncbi:aspartate--tRNA ligase 1 [Mycoplasma sp. CAG:472]|nr:aspartate--tRNA ligase 1 [Mycoplasma sp. CAG:472]
MNSNNKYRNKYCGEITIEDAGKTVRIGGWINSIRNLGSLVFLTVRDESGIVQVISEESEKLSDLTRESTVTITGTVQKRSGNVNPNMKTGEIEIILDTIEVLGKCENVLPFEINRSKEANEETRLKYRYLDLRNKEVHDKIVFRSKVVDFIRKTMKEMDFTEITTPIITGSSPEGARDFVIPSRNYHGKFYALPQAPQIYKQLLMVSGFNRYFQIAPCFRDEDCRADRTLEFYQLDLEMSFATDEDVYEVGEKVFYETFKNFTDKYVSPAPFRRISFKEAMLKYGCDKPDLRNPLIIEDASDIFENSEFAGFKGKIVRCIKCSNVTKSNSWYKHLEEFVKSKGAGGLAYLKKNDGEIKSAILKFLSEEEIHSLDERFELKDGDVLFILAGDEHIIKIAGLLRNYLGEELELTNHNRFEFCIVNDFPFFEYNEEDKKWDFGHNPFSMPQGGIDALNNMNPGDIVAYQYDFVCNGNEMASGAVRNHDINIMKKAFSIAGYSEDVVKDKFRSLYTAFTFGAPPHAGMAPGIDRIVMLLTDEENLREVQVFPPNVQGMDLLMGSPNTLTDKQLKELGITITEEK